MTLDAASPGDRTPRVVLVETSDALPGLLPFQSWDALATADEILVRDVEGHPAATQLWFAGVELQAVEPAQLERAELDLSAPGRPEDRRVAKALLQLATARGRATYLQGPDDDQLSTVLASMAPAYDAELELVFFAQQPRGAELLRLVEVMRELRDPETGCPWDLEQDHASLATYLVEETYELLDAIDSGWEPAIREELGDVLLQVVFHAQVATDRDAYTIDDVARAIADKLVSRHPHVFAEGEAATAEEVQANWDELKAAEKGRTGPFEGVPLALPALGLTEKLQRRAAKTGFEVLGPSEAHAQVRAAAQALADGPAEADDAIAAVGRLLAGAVALARHRGVDAEGALRQAAREFRLRFEAAHQRAGRDGADPRDLDAAAWRALWDQAAGSA